MRSAARRPASNPGELGRAIGKLAPQGYSAREMAARLGISTARVRRLAKRTGVDLPLGLGANARKLSVPVKAEQLPALDAVAEHAAVDRVEIARRILRVALADGGRGAIRLLGRLAEPARTYSRRPPAEEREAARRAAREEKAQAARNQKAAQEAQAAAQAAAEAERFASRPDWLKAATEAGTHPLRAVRQHLGLRQKDVAEAAGFGFYGENDIGDLERSGKPLTPRMAVRLAAAMGVEPAWLGTCPPGG